MNKLSATFDSKNFFVTILNIVILAFTANQIEIVQTPEQIVDLVSNKDILQ